MKQISFDEWHTRYYRRVFSGPVASGEVALEADGFTFYDNGAVKENSTGDFVVKLDQIGGES